MQLANIRSNLLPAVLTGLRDRFGLQQFVETGTCGGNTSTLAALAFPKVFTAEIMPHFHAIAKTALRGFPHVSCFLIDSRDMLRQTDWSAEPPTMFYLDAHRETSGEVNGCTYPVPCPLLEELTIIGGLYGKHCIVIDDYFSDFISPVVSLWPNAHAFNGKERFEPSHHRWCAVTPAPCNWQDWIDV